MGKASQAHALAKARQAREDEEKAKLLEDTGRKKRDKSGRGGA